VNFERHDGHAIPRVFVPQADPMFVAVCAPHDEPGPWGEPVPFVPRSEAEQQAEAIARAARARAEPESETGAAGDGADDGSLTRYEWEVDTRSGLAVAALRLLQGRLRDVRFDIEVCANAEQRRPALAAYRDSDQLWFSVDDENRAIVSTRSLDAVRFITGVEVALAAWPYVTVAVRAEGFAAALWFDADQERFYVAERGSLVFDAALDAARDAGFEQAVADEGVWVMSGLHDYFASLKTWAQGPADALPF
jgi:hypothetical protein